MEGTGTLRTVWWILFGGGSVFNSPSGFTTDIISNTRKAILSHPLLHQCTQGALKERTEILAKCCGIPGSLDG